MSWKRRRRGSLKRCVGSGLPRAWPSCERSEQRLVLVVALGLARATGWRIPPVLDPRPWPVGSWASI